MIDKLEDHNQPKVLPIKLAYLRNHSETRIHNQTSMNAKLISRLLMEFIVFKFAEVRFEA